MSDLSRERERLARVDEIQARIDAREALREYDSSDIPVRWLVEAFGGTDEYAAVMHEARAFAWAVAPDDDIRYLLREFVGVVEEVAL